MLFFLCSCCCRLLFLRAAVAADMVVADMAVAVGMAAGVIMVEADTMVPRIIIQQAIMATVIFTRFYSSLCL